MSKDKYDFEDLKHLLAYLREPKYGCPWDLQQTPETIVPFTIEEVYEVVEAIEIGYWPDVLEELGDLLLQIAFYAQMADERGEFDLSEVVDRLVSKMIHRHPHVFPEGKLVRPTAQTVTQGAGVDEVKANWEAIKAQELAAKAQSRQSSPQKEVYPMAASFSRVPKSLCALERAKKIQAKAAKKGLDWSSLSQVRQCLDDELKELDEELRENTIDQSRVEDELGDILFTCINLARHLKVDGAQCLRRATRKFQSRAQRLEALWYERHPDQDIGSATNDVLHGLWMESKLLEKADNGSE